MSFKFNCPHCGQRLEAQEEWIGMSAPCTSCAREITIPAPEGNTAPAIAAATAKDEAPFFFVCPECGKARFLPPEKNGKLCACEFCQETVIALPTATRECPNCHKPVNVKASFCKHCKTAIPPMKADNVPAAPQPAPTAQPNDAQPAVHDDEAAMPSAPAKKGGHGCLIAIVVILILALFGAALLEPALEKARAKAKAIACINNLKQLGLAIYMYSVDNHDRYPTADGCRDALKEYIGDNDCFHCPYGEEYTLFVNGQNEIDALAPSSNVILAMCPHEHNGYINCLLADGHCESLPAATKVNADKKTGLPVLDRK